MSSWFSRICEGGGRPSLAIAERFLVAVSLYGDWVVVSWCLFPGEVLGYKLDVMGRSTGRELPSLPCNPGCVAYQFCDPVPHHPGSHPFLICTVRLLLSPFTSQGQFEG